MKALARFEWTEDQLETLPKAAIGNGNNQYRRDNPTKDQGQTPEAKTAEAAKQTELAKAQTNPLAHPVTAFGLPDMVRSDQVERYLAAYGEQHTFAPLPADIRYGTANECYKNASLLVVEHPELTYAEGYMYPSDKLDIPVMHAWGVTKDGTVVDNTPFAKTAGVSSSPRYFGVTYDRTSYLKYLYKAKLYGVLGSTDKNAQHAIETGGKNLRQEKA